MAEQDGPDAGSEAAAREAMAKLAGQSLKLDHQVGEDVVLRSVVMPDNPEQVKTVGRISH